MKNKIQKKIVELATNKGMKFSKKQSHEYTQAEWDYKRACDFLNGIVSMP